MSQQLQVPLTPPSKKQKVTHEDNDNGHAPTSSIPFTERSNALTEEVDLSSPAEMLRLFRQSDSQIFAGFDRLEGLYDDGILEKLKVLIELIKQFLSEGNDSCFVLSGAGTSGRLAFLTARSFNSVLKSIGKPPMFHYLIAGGDRSLIKAQENAEDNAKLGLEDLIKITEGKQHVMYIGITCGFSAPYVAGQLDYALNQQNYESVLIGFNDVLQARDNHVEHWDKTVKQVVVRMARHPRAFILNPIIGPEGITGSTRLKGGSATKILLDTIFGKAIGDQFPNIASPAVQASLSHVLRTYESTYRETYLHISTISQVVQMAGDALKRAGNIYYVSDNESFASFGLLDASECPPTFGSSFTDVQGVVKDGWQHMGNRENMQQFISTSDVYDISWSKLSQINKNDLLVVLHNNGLEPPSSQLSALLVRAKETDCKVVLIQIGKEVGLHGWPVAFDQVVVIVLNSVYLLHEFPSFGELCLKLVLNAISTGAHVLKGKVFRNRMIDLRVSNTKLYSRALGIVKELAKVSEDGATIALLTALYGENQITEEVRNYQVSKHIEKGIVSSQVVPKALLLATKKYLTIADATQALQQQPIVRKLLLDVLH